MLYVSKVKFFHHLQIIVTILSCFLGLSLGYKLATHGIKMYNSTSRGNYFKGIFGSLENNKSFGTWKKVGTVQDEREEEKKILIYFPVLSQAENGQVLPKQFFMNVSIKYLNTTVFVQHFSNTRVNISYYYDIDRIDLYDYSKIVQSLVISFSIIHNTTNTNITRWLLCKKYKNFCNIN